MEMKDFTPEMIAKFQRQNKALKDLQAPKVEIFPSMFYFEQTKTDLLKTDISSIKVRLQKQFDVWANRINNLPPDTEVTARKTKLQKYLYENNQFYSEHDKQKCIDIDSLPGLTDTEKTQMKAEIMEARPQETKRYLSDWDSYSYEYVMKTSIHKSINKLEGIISGIPSERTILRQIFSDYIGKITTLQKGLAILPAGNFNHQNVFNRLTAAGYISGNIDSWLHYFTGTNNSTAAKIVWNKTVPELSSFIDLYCPGFNTVDERFHKLRCIFEVLGGKQIHPNNFEPTKKKKLQKIKHIFE